MIIFVFFVCHWFLSLFFQTFFQHRYASHNMFTTSKTWERIFHFLAWICEGSSYLNPRAYAMMHRHHHAYSDTEKDPHSPHFFKDVIRMTIATARTYGQHNKRLVAMEDRFDTPYPEWNFVDRVGSSIVSRITFGLLYTWFYIAFATHWWMFLLLPIHYLMGPVHGAIVNWCGHKYGYANYDNGDKSKNSTPLDFLMLGELFQNNHHKYPESANFAKRWFELDPVYPIMKFMDWIHIIKLKPGFDK